MLQGGGKATGSRRQVLNGTAKHTAGGLEKTALKRNKYGDIVSRAASDAGKRSYSNIKDFHALVMSIYRKGAKGAGAMRAAMKQASKEWHKRK